MINRTNINKQIVKAKVGKLISTGLKAVSKKRKGKPKSKEGPTKKINIDKPITTTNQQKLLKEFKRTEELLKRQDNIGASVAKKGSATEAQRKASDTFIRYFKYGSAAKGPKIIIPSPRLMREAFNKGIKKYKILSKEIDKNQTIRSRKQKASEVPAGEDTLYYKKGTGKSTISKPRGYGAARYNKRRK